MGRKSKFTGVILRCGCEWDNCTEEFEASYELKVHQLEHFKELYSLVLQGDIDPTCGICGTLLEINDWGAWERHSYYHAWSIYLRAKGRYLQQARDWPPCLATTTSLNMVPELPTRLECGWQFCNYQTNDISDFLSHINTHPNEYNDSRYPVGVALKCLWEGCSYVARRLKNLTIHVDSHAQAKRSACPTCGLLLVNATKLEDHLKRQQVQLISKSSMETVVDLHPSIQPSRCTWCRRLFATERLLMVHVQRHVNRVKCPFCELTTQDKSTLERHISFRHSSERPFACNSCDYRGKALFDLQRHVSSRHGESKQPLLLNTPPSQANETDLDDESTSNTNGSFVRGPLAAAGALLEPTSPSCPGLPVDSVRSITYNPSTALWPKPIAKSKVIRCGQPGCHFVTTKRMGYLVHLSRKHDLIPKTQDAATSLSAEDMSLLPPTNGSFYACHLCSVVKRRGFDLSKHLVREHNLSRPFGLSRFHYVQSDDGFYRLQLTRLDTAPVAAALLGEAVVNRLLSSTPSADLE